METNDSIAWHALPVDQVAEKLATDGSAGLAPAEVKARRAKYGPNEMTAKSGTPAWVKFLQQFNSAVVYVLLGAAVGCFFLGEVVDCLVIALVLLANAIVGYIQEAKAEKAISALNQMMVTEATVRREGRKIRVPCSMQRLQVRASSSLPPPLSATHAGCRILYVIF